MRNFGLSRTLACFAVAMLVLAGVARGSGPAVVATSTRPFATGFNGYNNKVVVDPFGNVFTVDSSNGRLWEIPAGSTAPVQIFLQFSTSAIAATNPVTAVRITNPGSGYTTAPTVTFSASPTGGTQATGTAIVSSAGTVTVVQIGTAGSGYTTAPTVTFSAPPAGGVTATGVATTRPVAGLNAVHGLTVDKYGDVIVSSSSGGNLYFLQNNNGVLCTTCNAAATGPLDLTASYGFSTLTDYYGVISDAAIDGSGNLYVAMSTCNSSGTNACGTSKDSIFLLKNITNLTNAGAASNPGSINAAGTANLYIGALPGGKAALNMAVDNSGHLFYVDGVNLYVVNTAAATPTPVTLGTFKAPSGVSVDAAGNVFVVDNNTKLLYEIPNENGTLNAADQFTVAAVSNGYYSAGFDQAGTIYISDGSNKVINTITVNSLNAGPTPVGTASAVATMNYRFNAAVTPASISLVQGGLAATEFSSTSASTCAAGTAYAVGGSCAVAVTLTPTTTGLRQGAIVMGSGTTTPISTAYLAGTGAGAALTLDPGTQTSLTALSNWVTPSAVAVDGAGNYYVADAGSNAVQVVSASGSPIATIGSGLSKPGGVAVDGAGNVFIADTGNSKIVEVPNESGTLNTAHQTTVFSTTTGSVTPLSPAALSGPKSVAVEPNGAIDIADTGNTRVLRYTPYNGVTTVLGGAYGSPVSVSADAAGNVYIADPVGTTPSGSTPTGGTVSQVSVSSNTQKLPLKGLTSPVAAAVDASGSIYVVDSSTKSVSRYPNVGGTVNGAAPLSLSTGLTTPTGVAVSGSGNVAISDSGAPGAFAISRTNSTINFGPINIGLSSAPQSWTLTSAGTSTLNLGTPAYLASGSTASYAISNPSTTAVPGCTDGVSLPVGTVCGYNAVLSPVVPSGTLSDTLTFTSNAVNAPSLTELLTGTATNLSLTTTTLKLVSSASPVYGQAITVIGTVTTARSGVVPSGSLKFSLDGVVQNAVTLTQASPYTATFIFPAFGSLTAGTHVINASYSGDTNNAASNAAAPLIVTVSQQASTSALIVSTLKSTGPATVTATQLMQLPGSTYYFDVTVSPVNGGAPGGTVSLVAAGTTSPVLATATLSAGWAQLTYTTPSTIALGQYGYQVIYSGDSNYTGSNSGVGAIQIVADTYTVSIPTPSYTVAAGNSLVIPITITDIGGYAQPVTVGAQDVVNNVSTPACQGLPANVLCVFSPGVINPTSTYPVANASGVMNLTLNTSTPPQTPYPIPSGLLWPGCFVGLLTLAFATRRRGGVMRTRLLVVAFGVFLGGLTLGLGGCATTDAEKYKTPAGTSTITVTFSGAPINGYPGANIVETMTFQLTVQ